MARYRKRPRYDGEMPGLFDDLEFTNTSEFDAPTYPELIEAHHRKIRENRPEEIFIEGEDFTPLEDAPPIDRLDFISFGSGSSGNCTYVGDSSSGVLIDAGVDLAHVMNELKRNGIGMDRVKGIILTHDHSDHVRFVYTYVRTYRHLRVFCTPKTLNGLLRRHNISNRIKDYHQSIYKEHPFKVGNFTALAFEVQHDGTDNCGYFITHGKHKITVATDLGCISERADYYMRQANYLMIEANYDSHMLATGSYPEYLKARIRSDIGHLDNVVTAEYLGKIYTPQLRNIFLCHLSKDNNTPEIAISAVKSGLNSAGVQHVGNCSESPEDFSAPVQLMVLPRYTPSGLISLRIK